jgi:ribosomal protein L15E
MPRAQGLMRVARLKREEYVAAQVIEALRATGGNRSQAARLLGYGPKSRSVINRVLEKYPKIADAFPSLTGRPRRLRLGKGVL